MHFSPKRLMRALAMAAFGVAMAAPLTAAVAQTPPNVLVVGQIAEPQSLDPQIDTAANDFRILANVFDSLVRFKSGTLELEPALATSWEISEDGLTYTFKLREGVKFHDGTDFNADAVKFTFDRMLVESHPFYSTGPFPMSFLFSSIAETTVVDPLTVQMKLNEPFAPLLTNLAGVSASIVSPTAVEASGKDFGRNPVGTGPFKFKEWVANQQVTVEANPDYWDGAPALQAAIFRPITDSNTRIAEMLSGGLDVMLETPPDALNQFANDPNYKVVYATGPHTWFLILNLKNPVLQDVRVRQALNYAINKESLVNDVLQGTADVSAGAIPAAFGPSKNPDVAPYPYDPEKAKALLKEAGAEGAKLTFFVTDSGSGMLDPVPMGTAIQADLAAVGLDVEIQTFEWNTFLSKVNAGLEGQADMAQMAWMTSDPDTLPFLTLRTEAWPDKGGFNSGYYSNPDVDALLDKARKSTSLEERQDLYKQADALIHEDAPWLFVASWKQSAVTTAAVQNFVLQPNFNLDLRGVSKP